METILSQTLAHRLEEFGYRAKIVNISRLGDLEAGIQDLRQKGMLDEDFFAEWLSGFEFALPADSFQARSIIIVAVPQPPYRFYFETRNCVKNLITPPTYLFGKVIDEKARLAIDTILKVYGYRAVQVELPKKLLAVRSGLGAYGRNNICYVDGLGSFHRLAAFVSDLPCWEDVWQEPKMMAACQDCSACRNNCPSGAIASDRFLLYAERCLTYHNEKPGDIPFAEWLNPSWHAYMVGCMRCQGVCPQNKSVIDWIEDGARFSIAETELLLQGIPFDRLAESTREKLRAYDLIDMLDILPRNLKACGVEV